MCTLVGRTARQTALYPRPKPGLWRSHRRSTVHRLHPGQAPENQSRMCVRTCMCLRVYMCLRVCVPVCVGVVRKPLRACAHPFVGQVKKRKTQKSRALALFCSKNLGWERTCSLPMLRPCWEMGVLKPKKTGSRSQGGRRAEAGEMSARSQFGAMDGSTHIQNVRSLFLTATISAGPLAASPGPGHNYHPTGGLRAAGAGSRPWFA